LHFVRNRIRLNAVTRRASLLLVSLACLAPALRGEPLSKKVEIDFFRDVPSRNLKALATRSDGRLVAGPTLHDLGGPAPADLLWCLEATPAANTWLVGTGPDGRILEVTVDPTAHTQSSREVVKLDDPQVFALKRLADGALLAGTSPKGGLVIVRDGKVTTRVALPVDSIYDLLVIDANTALVATGNPGRIYKVDLKAFAGAGVHLEKTTDKAIMAERGLTLFGEIRDRNVRRIAALADGRIAAGSAPRGNVYAFARDGGAPVILQENRDAEVTDLLPQPNGDLYATLVFSSTTNESRITPPASAPKNARDAKEDAPTPPPAQAERFAGRGTLMFFPARGFPETLMGRANTAFYRVLRRADVLLLAGGEQGELAAYDLKARLPLTFAGSVSSQLNGFAPLAADGSTFLVLRNNAPGLAVLDFTSGGPREAETRRIDLGNAAQIGALRFNRLRALADADLAVDIRTSFGTDEVEGWSPWTPLTTAGDGGWRADNLRGRYAKLRLRVQGAATAPVEIDRATLFDLPQNRRPQLVEYRLLPPGFAVVPAAEPVTPVVASISQLLQAPKDEERRRGLMSGQVFASPGTQVALWNISDPDGDPFVVTYSIRRDGETAWTDLVNGTKDHYAQFDTKSLADGVYFTRLVVREAGPRPAAERLTHTYETDDLVVDHTAPELLEATARRNGDLLVVTVRGRDALSLLDGIEVVFNNGVREIVEQPADGIRDGREETFVLELPLARLANATSLEVTLQDAPGNSVSRRLTW